MHSDSPSVGIVAIDAEHQALFDLLGNLRQAMGEGDRLPVLVLLEEVGCQLALHMASEEGLMRQAGYSGYAWHREQHAVAIKRAARLLRSARRTADATGLLDYLHSWLPQHIGLHDRMMGAALRNSARLSGPVLKLAS